MSTKPKQSFVLLAKQKLGQLFIQGGVITTAQLDEALSIQKEKGGKVGQILIEKGYINEQTLLTYLAKQCGIPHVDLRTCREIPHELLQMIPLASARRQLVIPFRKEGNVLMVAMADPLNVFALDDMKLSTGMEVKPVLASAEAILDCIERTYLKDKASADELVAEVEKEYADPSGSMKALEDIGGKSDESNTVNLDEKNIEAPVIKLVNAILIKAIQMKASDIHLEPYEKNFRVRYRIDGVLHEQAAPPRSLQRSIVARIKILARADISEKRLPQDGRIMLKIDDKNIDIRASFLPTSFGEKVVMRILDSSGLRLDLKQLGFEPHDLDVYQRGIRCPYGMILITGPTGSGKSTTLYSSLHILNDPGRNILTIEDPVEYVMQGINQVGVNNAAGLTFAAGLRSFLRQDPDVIMVGEIRDQETGEIAANAALTGHLVLATLHTNDAPSAPARLLYLGVEPFLVASALRVIVAQRLIRVNCPKCKSAYEVPKRDLAVLKLSEKEMAELPEKIMMQKGKGCETCAGTGYKGRIGIHEVMEVTDEICNAIIRKASALELREIATRNGMGSLRKACFSKAMAGMTSLEELLRMTAEE